MNIAEMNRSMYDWCEIEPSRRNSLLNFWFAGSSTDLSRTLLHSEGNKIIVNVSQLSQFENVVQRLLLFTDVLVLRDTRDFPQPNLDVILVPDGFKGFDRPELAALRPPPVMRALRAKYDGYANEGTLANGKLGRVAVGYAQGFPDDTYDWIFGVGRPYIETGQVIYAPFIPPIEVELEFLRNHVSLPNTYGAFPLFSERTDWLNEKTVQSLLSLDLPTLDNIGLALLQEIKRDHHDEFVQFRNAMLNSVAKVQSSVGTDSFMQEVRHIQRNDIDDSLAKIRGRVQRIAKMRSLRSLGCLAGSITLGFGQALGLPETAVLAGASANIAALVAHLIAKLQEEGQLQEHQAYFLWRLTDKK